MEVTEFETGAIRSIDSNDVAYHLITPIGLRALAEAYNEINMPENPINEAVYRINIFLSGNRQSNHLAKAAVAICVLTSDKELRPYDKDTLFNYDRIPPIALRLLAMTYKEGALKYGDMNCELGFPVHDLINHAWKHIEQWRSGDRSENHLGHCLWNLLMSIHSLEMWPHLNEPYLRGPGCTLTEAIKARIENERRSK